MRAAPVLLALLTALSAGCLDSIQSQLDRVRGDEPLPDDFYEEVTGAVGPDHAETFRVPVEAGARSFTVTLQLRTESGDVPTPPVTPAQLTVTVNDPSGQAVAGPRTVNAQNPEAALTITEFPSLGEYAIDLKGNGLGGGGYGATYLLAAEVAYGPGE